MEFNFEGRNLLILLAAVNLTGGFIFGYNTGIIATALGPMANELGSSFANSSIQQGVVTVSILIGAMIASAFGGTVAEVVSHKRATMLLGVLTVVGALGSCVTSWLWVIVLFREILGLGVGFASAVCPAYVSEMAPPDKKGMLGACFQMSLTAGILVAYLVGLAFTNVKYDWHWMFGIGALPGVVMAAVGFIMPPLNRFNKEINQVDGVQPAVGNTNSMEMYMLLFTKYRKELIIGLLLATTLQLTGINAIIYYSPNIFTAAGLSEDLGALVAGVGVGAWNFVATFGALFLVERTGRRPLILGGLLAMAVSDLIVGILFCWFTDTAGSIITIIFVFVFVGAFEVGIGSLFWPLLSEIYPPEVRTAGATVMNLVQWTFNVILSLSFLAMVDLIHQYGMFWIFSFFGFLCLGSLYYLLPETKQSVGYGTI